MDNTIWKIAMFGLVVSVLGLTISYTSQKREIIKLQTTVIRQANAIEQLEKQQNNTINYGSKNLNNIPNYD